MIRRKEHRKNIYPSSLSGGEKQRVVIAHTIIHKPFLLILNIFIIL
ncbi:ATP-binding cassette domain-containing protein [Niallia endozanthoxylica]|uniref:ATP-binding cassette domain-containing protein n=1 Tax=Niallia endozanthoxylica TaxID=2036016 RepID=A0A5J5HG64_9BACI|nr:ATP-binding cassette domain-containing protein [Niallia endozanthoxylica]